MKEISACLFRISNADRTEKEIKNYPEQMDFFVFQEKPTGALKEPRVYFVLPCNEWPAELR